MLCLRLVSVFLHVYKMEKKKSPSCNSPWRKVCTNLSYESREIKRTEAVTNTDRPTNHMTNIASR